MTNTDTALDRLLARSPRMAVRPEPFGALAYHYDSRALMFLRHPDLVELLTHLDGTTPLEEALKNANIERPRWPTFTKALKQLETRGFLTHIPSSDVQPTDVSPGGGSPRGALRDPPSAVVGSGSAGPTTASERAAGAPKARRAAPQALRVRNPVCLTWELTYACNLQCVHCLSSSGRRDPHELTTSEAFGVLDELAAMQVFYINIGGGEPMVRRDFFPIVDYAIERGIGVKFSTNGTLLDESAAERLAAMNRVDVQISLDGIDAATNDAVRGDGSFARARRAMDHLAAAGFGPFKLSVVVTRHNVDQLDELHALAESYGAQLRVTRLRPSGRGADSWHDLHPTNEQQRGLFEWLLVHTDPSRDRPVLTGDSFFHLNALSNDERLPGLNLCGAGRVVCLIDPLGDVYACPFALHDEFFAGSVRDAGGFTAVWRDSERFAALRAPDSPGACGSCGSYDACRGGCMAAKFFTGLPLDGPDPECAHGHGAAGLAAVGAAGRPSPSADHSSPVTFIGLGSRG